MKRAFAFIAPIILIIAVAVLFLPLSSGAQGDGEEAVVTSHNSFIEPTHIHIYTEDQGDYEGDFLHVIGVVQVTGVKNIKDVGVEVTFYDSGGERIVAGPVHSMLGFSRLEDGVEVEYSLLGPGDKLPFHVVLLDEAASAKVASYKISVKYEVTEQEPYTKLAVLSHRLWLSSWGEMSVIGELANTGEQYVGDVSVHVAFYDPAGKIVGAEYYSAPMDILVPGEKIAFATYSFARYSAQIEGDVTYELMPICIVEDLVPYKEFKILSHRTHMDEYGYLILEGEVANIGDRDAADVVVAADFYDREGKPLGGYYADDTGEHRIPEIKAGKSSPFRIEFWEIDLAPHVANYTFHVSSGPYTSLEAAPTPKPEFVRTTPSLQAASVAVAVGAGVSAGLTATVSATGLGQRFDAAVSNMKIPDSVKDFLKFYAEKTFKHLTREELEARKRRKFLSGRKLLSLAVSALVLVAVFSYVELNGLPKFLYPTALLSVVPYVLATVVLFFVVRVIVTSAVAASLSVWCEFRIWLYGLIALVVSGFGFLLPFGSPGRTDYEGEFDLRKAGLIAALKIFCDLAFMVLFYAFSVLGYKVMGDAGLLMATMSACYSSFPFKPLEGKAVYRYSRPMWVFLFAGALVLFISTSLNLLPSTIYLFGGLLAAALFVAFLILARRRLGPTAPTRAIVRPAGIKYCIECGEVIPEVAMYCPRCASRQE